VQRDGRPPGGPAQRRVLLAGGGHRDLLLHDRPARVGECRHERQEHGQREGAHGRLLCVGPGRCARRGERSALMDNTMPLPAVPVVVPEHSIRTTADGVPRPPRHPLGGRPTTETPDTTPTDVRNAPRIRPRQTSGTTPYPTPANDPNHLRPNPLPAPGTPPGSPSSSPTR